MKRKNVALARRVATAIAGIFSVLLAVLAALFIGAPAAHATVPSGQVVNEVEPLGDTCTYPLCGRVLNQTNRTLQLSQNWNETDGCWAGPHADLAPGQNSYKNPYKDTDCFRSNECSIFFQGRWRAPGEWIRIHNLPTPYVVINLGC